ncbi:MAG TPA: hypothetical protein VGN23_03630 [Verrucomicrobiae bacterium]|jgi:hypothetical protein
MKEIITDSIRYWESRRIVYNAALALVLGASYWYYHPSLDALCWQSVIGLLLAAVIANVLYCSAYLADIFFQSSEYRPMWKQYRGALLVIGTAFAAGLWAFYV